MTRVTITKNVNTYTRNSSNGVIYTSFTIREDTDAGNKFVYLGSQEELIDFMCSNYNFYPTSYNIDMLPSNTPISLNKWITDSVETMFSNFDTLALRRNGRISSI